MEVAGSNPAWPTMQNFDKTDEPCTCLCHQGVRLYHMVIRPCCETPIDGGQQKAVFELEHDGEIVPVIAQSKKEAELVLERFLKS